MHVSCNGVVQAGARRERLCQKPIDSLASSLTGLRHGSAQSAQNMDYRYELQAQALSTKFMHEIKWPCPMLQSINRQASSHHAATQQLVE